MRPGVRRGGVALPPGLHCGERINACGVVGLVLVVAGFGVLSLGG